MNSRDLSNDKDFQDALRAVRSASARAAYEARLEMALQGAMSSRLRADSVMGMRQMPQQVPYVPSTLATDALERTNFSVFGGASHSNSINPVLHQTISTSTQLQQERGLLGNMSQASHRANSLGLPLALTRAPVSMPNLSFEMARLNNSLKRPFSTPPAAITSFSLDEGYEGGRKKLRADLYPATAAPGPSSAMINVTPNAKIDTQLHKVESRHLTARDVMISRPATSIAMAAGKQQAMPIIKIAKAQSLAMRCDQDNLTPYQCLAREQIELFEAEQKDVDAGTKGRNRYVTLGQVGIRCRHCAHLPHRARAKGSVIYPSKLTGIYQAAQNMTNSHVAQHCQHVPEHVRQKLTILGNKKSSAGGGKDYWSAGAKIYGVMEDEHGLRFAGDK